MTNILLFISLCFSFFCLGETIYVSPYGNDGYTGAEETPLRTINKALDYLKGGGTVVLRGGVYSERIYIGKKSSDVTIKSFDGELAVIDGSAIDFSNREHGVLQIDGAARVVVDGIVFSSSNASGVAICNSAFDVTIKNNKFIGEFAWSPIKVCYSSGASSLKIINNYIERRVPLSCRWGGQYGCWAEMISISAATDVRVQGNVIERNQLGEGIDVKDGSSNVVVVDNIVKNTASNAIYLDARGVVKDVVICNNSIYEIDGNGIALATEAYDFGAADIINVEICNNKIYHVKRLGLGIGWFTNGRSKGGASKITGVVFSGNEVVRTGGVLIGCSDGSSGHLVEVSNVYLINNYFSDNKLYKFCGLQGECEAGEGSCSVSLFENIFVNKD